MFKSIDGRQLAVIRILFGLLSLIQLLGFYRYDILFYSNQGWLPVDKALQMGPSPQWSLLTVISNPFAVDIFFMALFVAAVFMTIGFCTRWSVLAVLVGLISLTARNWLGDSGEDKIPVAMCFYLFFSSCGSAWSVDSFIRRYKKRLSEIQVSYFAAMDKQEEPETTLCPAWTLVFIQLQVCLIYLNSGLDKLHGMEWINGTAILTALSDRVFSRWDVEWLRNYPFYISAMTLMTKITLLWELLFTFLVLNRRTRWIALGLGVLIHGGIVFLMNVHLFGQMMIASYAAFLPNDLFVKIEKWIKNRWRAPSSKRAVALFDFECSAYVKWALLLSMVDWTRRVEWVPLQDEARWRKRLPDLNVSQSREIFHFVTPNGAVLQGAEGIEQLLYSIPSIRPLCVFLVLPGVSALLNWAVSHGRQIDKYLHEFFTS